MKLLINVVIIFALGINVIMAQEKKANNGKSNIYKYVVKDIDHNTIKLDKYTGKVLLIVNVASKCGFTPQYAGLERIYEKYKNRGFEILAFPCNDFKNQEPGSNMEIKQFCEMTYGVKFPLFDKIHVVGEDVPPLYRMLTNNAVTGSSPVKWNFEKFLIDKKGNVVARYRSRVKPDGDEITKAIEKELAK